MLDFSSDYITYVLAAYGLVAMVLLALLFQTLRQAKVLKRQIREMKLHDPGQKDSL